MSMHSYTQESKYKFFPDVWHLHNVMAKRILNVGHTSTPQEKQCLQKPSLHRDRFILSEEEVAEAQTLQVL